MTVPFTNDQNKEPHKITKFITEAETLYRERFNKLRAIYYYRYPIYLPARNLIDALKNGKLGI